MKHDDYEEMVPWGKTKLGGGRCYESHPALKIGNWLVYGGNSGNPVVKDADIYVSLQAGQYVLIPHPWQQPARQITQIMYPITDQSIPNNKEDFKQMVGWLCNQLQAGKKIHIGCIGGHGRTGMVLAAMVNTLMPEEKAPIGYVRANYCTKAVESDSQVKFLKAHYGAEDVLPRHHKTTSSSGSTSGKWTSKTPQTSNVPKGGWATQPAPAQSVRFANSKKQIDPVPSARNIFVETR